MKRTRIIAAVAAAVCALPACPQANIEKALEALSASDCIVSERHVNETDPVTGMPKRTSVYFINLSDSQTDMLDNVLKAFRASRGEAAKIYSRLGDTGLSDKVPFQVGTGEASALVGKRKDTKYYLMVFPDRADTTGARRYVYAAEWRKDGDTGATELMIASDYGAKPASERKPLNAGKADKDAAWIQSFDLICKKIREFAKQINNGEQTVLTTQMYKQCRTCPLDDKKDRAACVAELRRTADLITSPLDKDLLLRGIEYLER